MMNCDLCGQEEAVIHIQQISGSDEVELHLCEKCAALKGITAGEDKVDFSITNLLTGLVDVKGISNESSSKKVCPRCGLTVQRFKKNGSLGCNECYTVFRKEISRIIEKMFGRTRHTGKYPKRLMAYKTFLIDIEDLKRRLDRAVKDEKYEEAARLRDQIKELESHASGEAP